MRAVAGLGAACGLLLACSALDEAASREPIRRGGVIRWIDVPDGRLKTRVYSTESLSDRPVLVVMLHGDIFDPAPSYQYYFAQALAEGFDPVLPEAVSSRLGEGPGTDDIVTAGILRPGYTDEDGDRSDGEMGFAVADNYTTEVVDAVALAVGELKAEFDARAVILVGHSGGGAIAANVLGRHPDLADAALLIACGCDPVAWRARMSTTSPFPAFRGPTPSLLPLDLAPGVRPNVKVRLVVGELDDVAPPEYSAAYAEALRANGVTDVEVDVAPGLGHNIAFTRVVFDELEQLLSEL